MLVLPIVALIVGCAAHKPSTQSVQQPASAQTHPDLNPDAYNHFTNAMIYEQEGVYDEAIKEYEVALSYEPLSYDIRMALGQLFLNLNRGSQALDVVLPIPQKTGQTYGLLCDCYMRVGRNAEAEATCKRALSSDSTNVALNYNLAILAVKTGKVHDAARFFRAAAHYSGDNSLYQQIAELYAGAGMFDSAAASIEFAIKLSDLDSTLYARLAVYYHAGGRKAEAKEALQRGITAHPHDARLRAQLLETYNSEKNLDSVRVMAESLIALPSSDNVIYERVGQVLLREKLDTLAAACFRKALAIDSASRYALFYLGRTAIDQKQFDSARTYFTRLLAADSTLPDGWINLASIDEQQKKPDKALALLETALNHVTTNRDNIQFYLAQLLSVKRLSDSAISLLKSVVAEGGDTIRALSQIGAEYERLGSFDKSVETFELLLSIDSANAQALNYLGYMLADRGVRLEESLRMIEKAVAADSANGAYLDSYAWVLYRLGRHPEALTQINKARTLLKTDATVIDHYGDIQAALGNLEDARRAWTEAANLDPQNQKLKDKLKR
jgi:tetratricopeptide (TPR) repeat protein